MSQIKFGRDREVAEMVKYERPAQVGRLLLGELNEEMDHIFLDSYVEKPRKQFKVMNRPFMASGRTRILQTYSIGI